MTCKDCYHYELCHMRIVFTMDYDEATDRVIHNAEKCDNFKDKLLIIELPCKVTSRFKERLTKYCEETSIRHNLYERCVDEL